PTTMSFPSFLRELGQLIQQRAVISCVFPRLVALDTVNELAGLTCAHPGLTASAGADVRAHLDAHPAPALLFVSEHLEDGDGADLIRDLHGCGRDHRSVLILTDNHDQTRDTLEDPAFTAIVADQNIGGPTCVLTQALRAVNRDKRFVDPRDRLGCSRRDQRTAQRTGAGSAQAGRRWPQQQGGGRSVASGCNHGA
ncbi:MAG: hypothetical protein O2972_09510, partial [Cyanobacteria bacterium]|nr:hypothetical protein [Cyanobacteriota bacterium]